jgi:DNA-binding transcriptional regulator YiaG
MDEYDPNADAIGSWEDAVAAIRERHRQAVRTMAPALWRLRTLSRTSRPALAKEVGVSVSLLQAWETGRKCPPADLFYRWRDLLGA